MVINNFTLIIGAMKCGTTSLFSYLCQHPEIASPIFKEPNFFSYDERWNNGWKWYLSRWDNWDCNQHKIALEASINYTKIHAYPEVISRIKSMENRASFKFIYVVRDPLDRIESHYTHAQAASWGNSIKKLEYGIDPELIETSKYAKQISKYFQAFPKSDILIINFNDLKSTPDRILKQICVFLEVDPNFKFSNLNEVYNPSESHMIDVKLWRLLRPIKALRKISMIVSPEHKQKVRSLIGGKKLVGKFKLSEKHRNFVLSELQDDIIKLKEVYKVDISQWNI